MIKSIYLTKLKNYKISKNEQKKRNLLRDLIFMTSTQKDGMREEIGIENCRLFADSIVLK